MSAPSLANLRECLLDLNQPVTKRTMAAFHLRTMGTPEAVDAVAAALLQREDGALMRHELAYILGQMGNRSACSILSRIVEDESDDVLVRHESAEALGALGDANSIAVLEKYVNHKDPEIAETCQIAIDLIKWQEQKATEENIEKSHYYLSHDPAPPMAEKQSIKDLKSTLMDRSTSLFHRYRAMFSLRNENNDEAALALLAGFDDESALFRHEIAFVLGQMQRPVTVDGLSNVLRNTSEHRMVRHEAAEALGAIGGSAAEEVLGEFANDPEIVVTQSCEVALDTIEYWGEFAAGTGTGARDAETSIA